MALSLNAINLFSQGVEGIFNAKATGIKAHGLQVEAKNYELAAKMSKLNAQFARESTDVAEFRAEREFLMTQGAATADVASSGLQLGGSAIDVLRDNAAQGALTQQILERQGQIQIKGFETEAETYTNLANEAKWAAKKTKELGQMQEILGYAKAAVAVASVFL